ncbi:MAG: pyruvate kinase alpha/beta domain-containing protein [Candidatus Aminicenantales bacterium]
MTKHQTKSARGTIVPCLYFDAPGLRNTDRTLEMAACRARELDIADVVVASSSGRTGLLAARRFAGWNVVVVAHSTGFSRPNHQELGAAARRKIEAAGGKVLICQHAFGGVGRAVRKKFGTYELEEIVAFTLRTFGQGTKVAVEIALMAADAGLIPVGKPCLAIGGTDGGADTAVILVPANAQEFFDMKILEIVAKPR